MASGLLEIQPSELAFPFEVKKQSTCSMQFTNKSDQFVAFKVKTTNPKQYCVRPNIGVVQPRSTCDVTVTMQAQKEAPPDMHCRDKFLIQTVVTKDGSTTKDVTAELFSKEPGKVVEECKLRVVYIPVNHPSPVPEEPEEGTSPRFSNVENGNRSSVQIIKLTEERTYALQQNEKLRQELVQTIIVKLTSSLTCSWFFWQLIISCINKTQELLKKERNRRSGGFSLKFLLIVGLLGALAGYIMKRT
ncbi:vesicle-associated protein 1-3-like protein [Carex littledalei]|uniref:Vesicle-associated protein 1-3-like protein n=1 Tax=Carex littledalei TaxID=544730 RepID=A0A833QFP7_9POAL|nr:vesicle-associated protein 1-3-like protein [Carex littledalei]